MTECHAYWIRCAVFWNASIFVIFIFSPEGQEQLRNV